MISAITESETVSLVKNSIDEKGLDLKMEVRDTTITSDRRRLLQSLLNLLSNAVKFTDKGMITIHTKTINSMTNISITGTGTVGVTSEYGWQYSHNKHTS